jgi:hypothetical protein
MYNIRTASVSMRGSLFSFGGMVGSMCIMVSGGKCMMTCVSSNIVLYGASFVVHSSSGMVKINTELGNHALGGINMHLSS